MRGIFISYRREDAEGQSGRLFDDLVMHFGEDQVFMDVTGIEPGRDFRRAIDEKVGSCAVLLAVIGKDWLDAKDASGVRRLDDPMDFVRFETAAALKRDIPIVPVLVRGASMPRAEHLPPDLRELAYRHAVELTHARWDSDVQVLIKALRAHLSPIEAAGPATVLRPASEDSKRNSTPPPSRLSIEPRISVAPSKRSLRLIVALAAIVIMAAGYFGYDAISGRETDKAVEAYSGPADIDTKPNDTDGPTGGPKVETPPSLPASYTLAGTWESDNVTYAAVDSKEKGVFEMEQIKPQKDHDAQWKAILKDRDVTIDVYAMPSGSHQAHMALELSLDGNRMVGLLHPGGASPDFPPEPVHFRRIK